jgi:hypothetical protein
MTPIDGITPIAEDQVIWVMPSGERRPGRIAICAPEQDSERDTTWMCRIVLEGLDHRTYKIHGEGSMQPLMLALDFAGCRLHDFISRGGKVLDPEEPGLSGVLSMFRMLMRRPNDPPPQDPALAELDAELAEGTGAST